MGVDDPCRDEKQAMWDTRGWLSVRLLTPCSRKGNTLGDVFLARGCLCFVCVLNE